jgi:MinD superfamily P-loop ATPase
LKQIAILSGKGGTGKTSLTAAFVSMLDNPVLADCDVDASNLHLLLNPAVNERHEFTGGSKASIDPAVCTNCGLCAESCRFEAIRMDGGASVNPLRCEGCGVCLAVCAVGAVCLEPHLCGRWFISETRIGPMVHARLNPGEENSGRLVSLLRQSARDLAASMGAKWILLDGPPGTGCPVISCLTGADYALLVTEPTLSGLEDLKRVAAVAGHFGIPTGIIINKADINPDVGFRIEEYAVATGSDIVGRVHYDPAFTKAQMQGLPVLDLAGPELHGSLVSAWNAAEGAILRERSPLTVLR